MECTEVKLEVYAPAACADTLREALSEAGAGRVGSYDNVCAVSEVTGHWRPLEGSDPFDGEVGRLSRAAEIKLEMRCPVRLAPAAVAAVRRVHPYEEPVVHVIPLLEL